MQILVLVVRLIESIKMKKRAPIVRLCDFFGCLCGGLCEILGIYSADYVKNRGDYCVDYVKSVIFAHITNESEYV